MQAAAAAGLGVAAPLPPHRQRRGGLRPPQPHRRTSRRHPPLRAHPTAAAAAASAASTASAASDGRGYTDRTRSSINARRPSRCSVYGEVGHNRRTCPATVTAAAASSAASTAAAYAAAASSSPSASSSTSSSLPPYRVAIVGAGFAGVAAAWHLLKRVSDDHLAAKANNEIPQAIIVHLYDEKGIAG